MTNIDAKGVHKSIAKHMLADGMEPVIDLVKSHGSWIVDARDSREYLDLFSMFASLSIGYNHRYILENQYRLTEAALNKPTNSDVYSTQMAEFVDAMGKIAQPEYLPYSFYIEGGALAVENALKAAFDWKIRKNASTGINENDLKVIHFKECFHGRSGYTMSLTDSPDKRKTMHFPKFDWPRISNPKLSFPLTDEVLEEVIAAEEKAVNEIKSVISKNKNGVAAIIIEPIQGEGGDNHFRKEFMVKLREIADDNDIILIYDEVQTGVGITGKMWAHQHMGEAAYPDIISFGKKTQVCGVFAGKRFDEVEDHVFNQSSRLNSTWGGNLTDMVRFTLYLDVIKNDHLVDSAAKNGQYLLDQLQTLENNYNDKVSNARGLGLFAAIDLNSAEERDNLIKLIQDEGALMLGCGVKTLRFRPHLNISKDEIDTGIEIISRALTRL
jgi:L-lysine 6-transaminase